MKKKIKLIILILAALLCGIIGYTLENSQSLIIHLNQEDDLFVTIEQKQKNVQVWDDEDISYFFLPSYVNTRRITIEPQDNIQVVVDNQEINQEGILFDYNQTYHFRVIKNDKEVIDKDIIFMKSENIPSMYIKVDEQMFDNIEDDKDVKAPAELSVINELGAEEFDGKLEYITGRGNSTWGEEKKPFTIKLEENESLCGLGKAKNYVLLANVMEGTKIHNKLALDMASYLGLSFTPKSTWVDLYIDEEYMGNYLLCEQIKVDEHRVEINDLAKSNKTVNNTEEFEHVEFPDKKGYILDEHPNDFTGGYLIEKDYEYYYQKDPCGFVTNEGYFFSMKAPSNASIEEVAYMQAFVQGIEDAMSDPSANKFANLDMQSLAKTYLINEITLNDDASETSMYFYKKKDEDMLYSGPVWDFDRTFGRTQMYSGCDDTILNMRAKRGSMSGASGLTSSNKIGIEEVLPWYRLAYEDPVYKQYVIDLYKDLLPYMNDLLEKGIDDYASYIRTSVTMDMVRWKTEDERGGHYAEFDNNIRFLKYFMSKRLQYLNDRWGAPYDVWKFSGKDEMHTVTFKVEDEIQNIQVKDGEFVNEMDIPVLDESKYEGWRYDRELTEFDPKLPILEDIEIYAETWD